jgi:hypothetical protein
MGPRSYERGKAAKPNRSGPRCPCFNGAAFLRTRKVSRRKIFNTSIGNRRSRALFAFPLGNGAGATKTGRNTLNINARAATE